jgi:hypothetical protein
LTSGSARAIARTCCSSISLTSISFALAGVGSGHARRREPCESARTLVLGWIYIVGLQAIATLVLSIGGDGWIGLVPFVGHVLTAMTQRVRNHLTPLGAVCLTLDAIPVALGTGTAIADVDRGDSYVTSLLTMLAAVVVVVVDGVDRLPRRTAQRADGASRDGRHRSDLRA